MKAYIGGLYSDDEVGNVIVFANTSKEAKKLVMTHHTGIADDRESYIDVYAKRQPSFDDMENCSDAEIVHQMWRECWWFHEDDIDMPVYGVDSDEDFYEWYDKTYTGRTIL